MGKGENIAYKREGGWSLNERRDSYLATRRSRRFVGIEQFPIVTGPFTDETAFDATKPLLLLSNPDPASDKRRVVISRLSLTQDGAAAGGTISIVIAIDSEARFSAGGTILPAQNLFAGESDTAGATLRAKATATAIGSGTQYVDHRLVSVSVPSPFELEFDDGLLIPAGGSFLVYTFAGTTGPTWTPLLEWVEEDQ